MFSFLLKDFYNWVVNMRLCTAIWEIKVDKMGFTSWGYARHIDHYTAGVKLIFQKNKKKPSLIKGRLVTFLVRDKWNSVTLKHRRAAPSN